MSSDKSTVSFLPLHYHGDQIRVRMDETETQWWVAADIGKVLGIVNVRASLERFPADEKGVATIDTHGGRQTVLLLNEPGLYRLIFQSRRSEAETLKRWVFHEVLPSLRRTGVYAAAHSVPPSHVREARTLSTLTVEGFLPAPTPRAKEHAEVSTHLIAVWRVLLQADQPHTNQDIARLADIGARTTRAHTRYLAQLAMVDVLEAFPRHLFRLAADAPQRNPDFYRKLEEFRAIYDAQQARIFRGLR